MSGRAEPDPGLSHGPARPGHDGPRVADWVIAFGFALAAIGAAIGYWTADRALDQVERGFDTLILETIPGIESLDDLRVGVLLVEDAVREVAHFSTHNPRATRASLDAFLARHAADLRRGRELIEQSMHRFVEVSGPNSMSVGRIAPLLDAYQAASGAVLRDDGSEPGRLQRSVDAVHAARLRLFESIEQADQRLIDQGMQERRQTVMDALHGTREKVGVVSLLALALTILFGTAVWRHMAQRAEHERRLIASHAILRGTLDSAADGVLVEDPLRNVVECNQRFREMWQVESDPTGPGGGVGLQAHMATLVAAPQRAEFERTAGLMAADPDTIQMGDWRLTDGRTIEYYTQPHIVDGRSAGRVWTYRDISARVRAERQLKAANEELEARVVQRTRQISETNQLLQNEITERRHAEDSLREQQAHLRIVLENVGDAILTCSGEGQVVSANAAALGLFGYRPDEVIKQRISLLVPDLYKGQEGRPPAVLTGVHEFYGLRRDGAAFPVEVASREVALITGCLFVVVVRDLTRQKEQESALIRAREMALRASRMKSDFLANMTHEIRTPMNGVLGMLTLLRETALDPEQREYCDLARRSGDALLTLLNDVLDFSKIEAGRFEIEAIEFDLPTLVEDVIALMAGRAYAKGLEIGARLMPDVPRRVRGDPTRLRQVLNNLLANAVKFTEQGDVSLMVDVFDEDPERLTLRFVVRDTGIGIPPEVQRTIFTPFSQADGSITRRYGGSGLGLAISREIVEMMGGEIGVTSQPGQGSVFRFTLQVRRVAGPGVVPRPELAGVRLLIVDDSEVSRQFLRHLASGWSMEVAEAVDANAAAGALDAARAEGRPFDVVLVDRSMPGADGLALVARVREQPAPVPATIMVTRYGDRDAAREARAAGVNGFLTKPVREAHLYEAIAAALGRSVPQDEGLAGTGVPAAAPDRTVQVLVVEDNEVNQAVARGLLERLGHRVTLADGGQEALDLLEREAFDIVLMDCQMPGLDGYETTRRQRAREAGSGQHLPIIAMTAHALPGDRARCLEAGMDDYLSKPVRVAELRAMIDRWLGGGEEPLASTRPDALAVEGPHGISAEALAETRELLDEAYDEVMQSYLADGEQRLRSLTEALRAGQLDEVRRLAHAFKGASGNIGALRLARLCAMLEEATRESTLHGVAEIMTRLEREFDRVRRAIGETL